jgi:hypothetical protein
MSLSVATRSLVTTLTQSADEKASCLSGLDTRIAGLRTQMETQSSSLRDRDFKAHFVKQLLDNEGVHALIDKCHIEAKSPKEAQDAFRASMLAHVQAVVGARTHRSESARQTQIDETMEALMSQFEPCFRGLKEGAEASSTLSATCSSAMETVRGINREFSDFVARSTEHRSDARRSTDASTLMRTFRDGCKRRSRTTTEPFFDLWRSRSIAMGAMANPQEIKHELFETISKQLMTDKGYSPEDASKKAWHLVQEFSAPAQAAIEAETSHLSSYIFALGANPAALFAFHHQDQAAAALAYTAPSAAGDSTRLKLEHHLTLAQTFEATFETFKTSVQRHMVKSTHLMRSSYTRTETVLTNVLRDDPEIAVKLIKNCLQTLSSATPEQCQLVMTQRLLDLLQQIDPEYYAGDKGLDKAQHFYRALLEKLPATGTDSFEDMKRMVTVQSGTWAVDPSLLETYKLAKAVAPFVTPSPEVTGGDSKARLPATAARSGSLTDDPSSDTDLDSLSSLSSASTRSATPPYPTERIEAPARPEPSSIASTAPPRPVRAPAFLADIQRRKKTEDEEAVESSREARVEPPSTAPATVPSASGEGPRRGPMAAITPEMLRARTLKPAVPPTIPKEAATEASASEEAPRRGPPAGITADLMRSHVLKPTARHDAEETEREADTASGAGAAPKPAPKPGFDPKDALRVKLRSRTETGAPSEPAPKELTELERRLAARKDRSGEATAAPSKEGEAAAREPTELEKRLAARRARGGTSGDGKKA